MQWNLIRLRKENKITQKQMADLLEIDITTYVKKEHGESDFKSREMFAIRNFFRKPLEEIFLDINCNKIAEIELEVQDYCKT